MIDEKLKNYADKVGVEVKFLKFSEPVLSVKDSEERLGVNSEKIVKSLVFVDEKNTPILAIISGDRRVNEGKLSKIHGSKVRIAKAREVEEFTGYKIGEVPPIGLELETYVDSKVTKFERVIAGGGSRLP